MKFIKNFFIVVLFLAVTFSLLAPTFVFAQSANNSDLLKGGIVKCGKDGYNGGKIDGIVDDQEQCHVSDIFKLVDDALKFVYTYLILPLATISIAIAGVMYLISGGDPGKRKKAGEIMKSTIIGVALVLTAWLIVHTIVKYVTDDKNAFYVPLQQKSQ